MVFPVFPLRFPRCYRVVSWVPRYAQLDFTTLDQRLGTVEELRELTSEAHRLGMYVIIDVAADGWRDGWGWMEGWEGWGYGWLV